MSGRTRTSAVADEGTDHVDVAIALGEVRAIADLLATSKLDELDADTVREAAYSIRRTTLEAQRALERFVESKSRNGGAA